MNIDTTYLSRREAALFQRAEAMADAHLDVSRLSIRAYDSAIVVPSDSMGPSGVVCDGRWLPIADLHYGSSWYGASRLTALHPEWRDEDVLYIGSLYDCWGHCLTDNLKHLWPLLKKPYCEDMIGTISISFNNLKLVYTLTYGCELPRSFKDLLALLGVEFEKAEQITRPTQFRRVFIPEQSFYLDTERRMRRYHPEYLEVIERLVDSIPEPNKASEQKIYLSRRHLSDNSKDFNEISIEEAFRGLGFSIVYPEEHDVIEQIQLLKRCTCLAATEGSCAHNALFMKPGSSLILLRKADYLNGYQACINAMKNLNVTPVDIFAPFPKRYIGEPWRGPFFLYPTRQLSACIGVKSKFPWNTYFKALWTVRDLCHPRRILTPAFNSCRRFLRRMIPGRLVERLKSR